MSRSRLFFATDIHGSETCFRKWLNAAAAYNCSILVMGGDLTGKVMVPIVQEDEMAWRVSWRGSTAVVDEPGVVDLEGRIGRAGQYPVRVTPSELESLKGDAKLRLAKLQTAIEERVRAWVQLADERLGDEVRAYIILGNDDEPYLAEELKHSKRLSFGEDAILELPDGQELLSFGYSSPTPWNTPREMSEPEILAALREQTCKLRQPENAVLNVHCPPLDTQLDQAPAIDSEFRPITSMGGSEMTSAGSSAVRAIIEEVQPTLTLHGHVHESAAAQRLGRTLCINPGSNYPEGILRGALVQLDTKKGVKSWQLTEG